MITGFCTGKLIDGRLVYWMPLDHGDIITPEEDAVTDEEFRRLEEKQDMIDEAQSGASEWEWA